MNIPDWTKPALTGAAIGAVALAIVGFTWGGWVTGGTAAQMASEQSDASVVAALLPYCIDASKSDPASAAVMTKLRDSTSYARRGIVEEAGWATPEGAEAPNRDLASACATALLS